MSNSSNDLLAFFPDEAQVTTLSKSVKESIVAAYKAGWLAGVVELVSQFQHRIDDDGVMTLTEYPSFPAELTKILLEHM